MAGLTVFHPEPHIVELRDSMGQTVATTDDSASGAPTTRRYVGFIHYPDGTEECDIDVLWSHGATVALAAAEAYAETQLQPGWTDVTVEGPIVGLY